MTVQIVSNEIYDIVQDEVRFFKNFTAKYIYDSYILGVSDVVVRFKGSDMQIIKNLELFNEKNIVNIRCKLLAGILKELSTKYPDLVNNLDLIIPVCLSDTSDHPLQDIPCLVFSKAYYSNNILIPSVNNLMGYWEVEHVHAFDIPLHKKIDSMYFVGSFTGNLDDLENNIRLQLARKFSNKDNSVCRLCRPPKMSEEYFASVIERCYEKYPEIDENIIVNSEERINIIDQLYYKYQICLDGHTCPWARLPWQMAANCVPIKVRNRFNSWREWFYPLLNPSKHFLEVDIDQLDDVYTYLNNNPEAQYDINEAGKEFVNKYCNRELGAEVLLQTLLLLNEKQNNIMEN